MEDLKVGDKIKALIDYPVGGAVKKDEIGVVTYQDSGTWGADFPSQKNYSISKLHLTKFELVNEKNNLLEETKKRYPIGTKFIPAHLSTFKNIICEVYDYNTINVNENCVDLYSLDDRDNHSFIGRVYHNGKWAEIVSKPKPLSVFKVGQVVDTIPGVEKSEAYNHSIDESIISIERKECTITSIVYQDGYFWYETDKSNNWFRENCLKLSEKWEPKERQDEKITPFWIKPIKNGPNNTSHPKYQQTGYCGKEYKVIEHDKNSYPNYGGTYICEGGYCFYVDCCQKIDKPTLQFEIGKWYKSNYHFDSKNHWYYLKVSSFEKSKLYGERISKDVDTGMYAYKEISYWDSNGTLEQAKELGPLTDLSEIQQYLPEGHVDKVKPIIGKNEISKKDFIIGKWYKLGNRNFISRFSHFHDDCFCTDTIFRDHKNEWKKDTYNGKITENWQNAQLLSDSEIQAILPDDHPDKVKSKTEPMSYRGKFKVGDTVRCTGESSKSNQPGGNKESAGWQKDHVFTITQITNENTDYPIAWGGINKCDVYFDQLELVKDKYVAGIDPFGSSTTFKFQIGDEMRVGPKGCDVDHKGYYVSNTGLFSKIAGVSGAIGKIKSRITVNTRNYYNLSCHNANSYISEDCLTLTKKAEYKFNGVAPTARIEEYPLTPDECLIKPQIDAEVSKVKIKTKVPVTLKNTEKEVKINVKTNYSIKLN